VTARGAFWLGFALAFSLAVLAVCLGWLASLAHP
jgi:hypothetical protein